MGLKIVFLNRPFSAIAGLAVLSGVLLLGTTTVSAELQYRWVFDKQSYEVNPGETVDVRVFLEETEGPSDTGVLNPESGVGMFGLGLGVFWGDDPQPNDPAKVLSVSDIQPNADAFNDTASHKRDVFENHATLVEVSDASSPIYGEATDDDTFRLWAGTFTFTAGDESGDVTPLRVGDNNPNLANSIALNFTELDGEISEGFSEIKAVPEPSSLALLGIAAVCLGGWTWRRKRRA